MASALRLPWRSSLLSALNSAPPHSLLLSQAASSAPAAAAAAAAAAAPLILRPTLPWPTSLLSSNTPAAAHTVPSSWGSPSLPSASHLMASSSRLLSTSSPAPPPPPPAPLALKPSSSQTLAQLLPGVALSTAVMLFGSWVADVGGAAVMASQGLGDTSPISGVPLAILTGAIINNTLKLPQATLAPGLRFCSKTLLQAGIVCVGAKVSAAEVAALGLAGLPVVAAAVTTGLVSVIWLNKRLGLPHRLGLLTAAGTSICGVTAITALAPAIQANQQEVAYAVANVVFFGLFGMIVYPYLAHHVMETSEQVGLFLGTAIHDTSQVMGAALTYAQLYQDEVALKVAAVTKLTRNLALVLVIPLLAALNAQAQAQASSSTASAAAASWRRLPLTTLFPPFILGFLAMAALRSAGDASGGFAAAAAAAGLPPDEAEAVRRWKAATSLVGSSASAWLLGTAMAALGLSTSTAVFKGLGLRPFAVGLAGACAVGLTGFTTARLLGGQVKFS